MIKAAFALNAVALVSLSVATIRLSQGRLEATEGWGQCVDQLHETTLHLREVQDRLWEIDCSAPLRPNAPFGGMGIWRATHCGAER